MLNLRSTVLLAASVGTCLWAIVNYEYVAEPLRVWMLMGLAGIICVTIASVTAPSLRISTTRLAVIAYCMFLVTVIYFWYLGREIDIASLALTAFVTVVMYLRVVVEVRRRKQA